MKVTLLFVTYFPAVKLTYTFGVFNLVSNDTLIFEYQSKWLPNNIVFGFTFSLIYFGLLEFHFPDELIVNQK